MGKAMREMKDAANGIQREISKEANEIKDKIDVKKLMDKERDNSKTA